MATIRETSVKLRKAAEELNRASDELNSMAAEIEGYLKEMNLGIEVWQGVACSEGNLKIGYSKVRGKWCLAIRRPLAEEDPEDWETWPFKDAPRKYRLETVFALPIVLNSLLRKAENYTAGVVRAKEKLENLKRQIKGESLNDSSVKNNG